MAIFDLNNSDGEWFQFFTSRVNERGDIVYEDPDASGGRVRIRSLVPFLEQLHAQRKQRAEFVLNRQSRTMERVVYLEEPNVEQTRKERDDTWDYCITDWENLFDKNGEAIPCTRENKILLMRLPVFDRFIARCLQLLADSGVQAEKASEKNG